MKIIYTAIFLILLGISNFFLFKPGQWFYQDQSSWPKNLSEAYIRINSQFHIFSTDLYYSGFDQGVFAFNNITYFGFMYFSTLFFGAAGGQVAISLFSYLTAFIAFFLFSTLFFKDKKISFCLALLYTFCPLTYSSRGLGIIHACAPLFVWSFYKFYTVEKNITKYLLVNIVMGYLWISNIRFFELNIFIVIPYLVYALVLSRKFIFNWKRIAVYFVINLFLFLPVAYSFVVPFFQHNPGIFNYGVVFNNYVVEGRFYDMFNPFQSINIFLYHSKIYVLLGLSFSIGFFLMLIKYFRRKPDVFMSLNIVLLLFGLTLFEMGYIFGRQLYPVVIKVFPFLTNAPFYGFYIAYVPFLFLLGHIGTENKKKLFILSAVLVIVAIIPFLNTTNFVFKKYSVEKIPLTYQKYFTDSYSGIPEATQYYPSSCWRALYMQEANTPTQCFNLGHHYKSIFLDNPRTISGNELFLAKASSENYNIDNLQITQNLKNIIVANDIVEEVDAGPFYTVTTIKRTKAIKEKMNANGKLSVLENENFNHYYFKNKDDYDFFIYSPKQIIVKNSIDSIFDNSLDPALRQVVFMPEDKKYNNIALQQNVSLESKISPLDPTSYYIELKNLQTNKPFALHLTQSFKQGWKIIWISKSDYEKVQCINNPTVFQKSNNSRCQFAAPIIDLKILSYIHSQFAASGHHLEGNYTGNTWIVYPDDIQPASRQNHELYAVLIYRNQIYYMLTILIAGSTLLLLIIYTLMQEVKVMVSKK